MPKNITSVEWRANNDRLPDGISFNIDTATFSGSPSTPGEFYVPVAVATNYGTDVENIKFIVNEPKNFTTYNFVVHVTNDNHFAQKKFSIILEE